MRCHFIVRTGFLKAFIMFPLNHQQLLKTSARNDSARFLEAFPVSIPSPTFIRIKNSLGAVQPTFMEPISRVAFLDLINF